MEIEIRIVRVSDNRIQFKLGLSKPLRKYFLKDTSYVKYDDRIDVTNVDSSILVIPMVSAIAPIAWAVGANVNVPRLDASYFDSLHRVKDVYRSFHSNFSFSGDIIAATTAANVFGRKKTGMLFSGGVDSLTSYLRYKHEKLDLFSIWGVPDIPPSEDKFWNTMWSEISHMANQDGVEAFRIKTDVYRTINHELLGLEFRTSWWGNVAGSLFLLGMCAPVTAIRETGTLIIASSYTEDFRGTSAFHPSIDHNISWADVTVVHDGYELSRQQKLKYLCQRESSHYLSYLRVCWDSAVKTNCGNCEKCLRTISGLVVEGVDPNNCNFNIDKKTFPRLKDCFIKGKMNLGAGQLFMWTDIQKQIPERIDTDISGSRGFLTWMKGFDLSKYRTNWVGHFFWNARLLFRNRRIKSGAIHRKIRCYYSIALAKLGFLRNKAI
ncbi:hypothetical protein ACFLVS_04760 [Chloroflexota bacterium]